jgi:hypothetical protein
MSISFFAVDRSITVGHLNEELLCYLPDYIPFTFDNDLLSKGLYHLYNNRLHEDKNEKSFTGSILGTYKGSNNDGPEIKLKMTFKFEGGLLRRRELILFDMT